MTTTQTDVRGTHLFHDAVTFVGGFYPPSESINNSHFQSDANSRLAAAKQIHRQDVNHQQAAGSDVATETTYLRIALGDGELKSLSVRPITAPTGGDKQFTVDLQKAADGSGSWSSLLNAAEVVDSSSVDDTLQEATLAADPTYDAGDALRLVITASGSTGSQGAGVLITAEIEEDPS